MAKNKQKGFKYNPKLLFVEDNLSKELEEYVCDDLDDSQDARESVQTLIEYAQSLNISPNSNPIPVLAPNTENQETVKDKNRQTNADVFGQPKTIVPKEDMERRKRKLSPHEMGSLLLRKESIVNVKGTLYIYQNPLYRPAEEERITAMLINHLSDDELNRLNMMDFRGVFQYLFSIDSIKIDRIPINKNCVMFRNGYFNIVTSNKLATSPKLFVTSMIQANYYPDDDIQTPVFDRFLNDCSQGDHQIEDLILSFIGYCLIPDLDGKCFFVLGTAPNSGKSVVGSLLEILIGEESVSSISLTDIQNSFGLGSLVGKTLNLSMDLSSDILNGQAVSRIKMLTGGDLVTVNEKYRKMFPYCNFATFVFGSNSPVRLKKPDPAFWDRMIVVPFLYSVPKEEQDKELEEKLWQERDGIVSKAMGAARELIENNYIFPHCDRAMEMKNSWECHDDSGIVQFVRKCCELDDGFKTHTRVLYQAYLGFCNRTGFAIESENQFSRVLKDVFKLSNDRWSEDGKNSLRGFNGVILSENPNRDWGF